MAADSVRIEAVIFDMDGLMLDTEPLYKAAWQQACAELGYELDDRGYADLIGLREQESEQELIERFGPGFPLTAFRRRWPELFHERAGTDGIPVKSGLIELLSLLEERGIARAVATSSHQRYADATLGLTGLAPRFAVVVAGDHVRRAKPAPDIYLEAARRLGAVPSRCIALEDSDRGLLAAQRAGMIPLLIPDLEPPSPEARAAAYRVLPSLHEAREVIAGLMAT